MDSLDRGDNGNHAVERGGGHDPDGKYATFGPVKKGLRAPQAHGADLARHLSYRERRAALPGGTAATISATNQTAEVVLGACVGEQKSLLIKGVKA